MVTSSYGPREHVQRRLRLRHAEVERRRRRPLVRLTLVLDRALPWRPARLRTADRAPLRWVPGEDVDGVLAAQLLRDLAREEQALAELDRHPGVRAAARLDHAIGRLLAGVAAVPSALPRRRRRGPSLAPGTGSGGRPPVTEDVALIVVADDLGALRPTDGGRSIGDGPWREVLVVPTTAPLADRGGHPAAPPGARLVTHRPGEATGRALDRALDLAAAEVVVVLPSWCAPPPGTTVADAVRALSAAAGPGRIATPRLEERGAPSPPRAGVALLATHDGAALAVPGGDGAPAAATATGLAARRAELQAAGGFGDLADVDVAAIALTARMVDGGAELVVAATTLVEHPHRPPGGDGWPAALARSGPALRRRAEAGSGRHGPVVALVTAAPRRRVAAGWGDWHLAGSLAVALRARGVRATVLAHDEAHSPAARCADVVVAVRGLHPVPTEPGRRQVLWVISHPETLAPSECDEADLVLVASAPFADRLRPCTGTPVGVLLQATDPRRFGPRRPTSRYRAELAVVGNARHVLRPSYAAAEAAGLAPAVVGTGWEGLVPPERVLATHVPNDQLADVYASVDLLLNDHWATMAACGFLSNRLFDALACGTPVISDQVPGLEETFDGTVPGYRGPEELGRLVAAATADPTAARLRAGRGRDLVLGAHTFAHRAAELEAALQAHGLL